MKVVSPVGMLVYTAVYTLAADGAVFETPKKSCLFQCRLFKALLLSHEKTV